MRLYQIIQKGYLTYPDKEALENRDYYIRGLPTWQQQCEVPEKIIYMHWHLDSHTKLSKQVSNAYVPSR